MKRDDILRAVGEIDDEYIAEAAPVRRKRFAGLTKFAAIAACVAVVFTSLGLYLFLPGDVFTPDVTKYEKSEYYEIITRIDPFYRRGSSTRFDDFFGAKAEDEGLIFAPSAEGDTATDTGNGSEYVEVPDNQVAGVIEGDLIKRSDSHIYYLSGETLYVYSIRGEESELAGSYALEKPEDARFVYSYKQEMFLSADASTVTLIYPYRNSDSETVISVVSLDVSAPEAIRESGRVDIYGSYLSARLTDGRLLLVSSYRPDSPNYKKPETFVPKVDTGEGVEVISPDCIIYPDELSTTTYTVVTSLDEQTLSIEDNHAFLSYSENLYVSKNAIYATRGYTDRHQTTDGIVYTQKTNVSKLSYADGKLDFVGTFTVDGFVNDQYSLDEHEGVLRVVTTTNKYGANVENFTTNANLYCIDASSFEILATVESFAPWGESVRSVRFDGNTAYVCTSIQLSDPVFFFDLSNLNNITYTDTGTIEGFSTSLINFGDGFLVGIGVGGDGGSLKIEVYTEEGGAVVPLCSYELKNTYYSTEYKSYYVDRENQLIGLGVRSYSGEKFNDKGGTGYVLLSFDGFSLNEILAVTIDGEPRYMRGVYIEDCFYVLSKDNMIVRKIS